MLAVSIVVLWLATRLGAYYEKWARPLKDEEREAFKVVFSATLTLLGLLVGFSFSMAVSRYDQRKNYEEAEANAIGTEYLRVELLPTEAADKAKGLLRSYLDQRIMFYKERREENLAQIDSRISQLQGEMWSVVRSAAAAQPSPVVASVMAGMNDVLNSQGYTQAAWRNRIPAAAWILMAAIAVCCCGLMGYSTHEVREFLLLILPVVLSIAFFLIADIESPRRGVIRVLPQNLISLAQSLPAQ